MRKLLAERCVYCVSRMYHVQPVVYLCVSNLTMLFEKCSLTLVTEGASSRSKEGKEGAKPSSGWRGGLLLPAKAIDWRTSWGKHDNPKLLAEFAIRHMTGTSPHLLRSACRVDIGYGSISRDGIYYCMVDCLSRLETTGIAGDKKGQRRKLIHVCC